MARLSKSRIMSSLQCQKKLWLETHRRDLARITPSMQAAFDTGHAVGAAAIEIYGQGRGVEIPYEGGLNRAEQTTRELMDGLFREPVFEATLSYRDVLVREDVLFPEDGSWQVIEVKASTRPKPEHAQDCAIQAWVHRGAGYPLAGIHLAHVDNQFVLGEDGGLDGLLVEVDMGEEALGLQSSVEAWVEQARATVEGPEPDVPVGQHCTSPYECPFMQHCWPSGERYPVQGLGGSKQKLGELVAAGYRDIRAVPADELGTDNQLRIHRVTRRGSAEVLPEAGRFIRALAYPRYHLDFETVAPAVPRWPGTSPYQPLPFQWSCHIEHGDGSVDHREFLDLSGDPPMRACAESLIEALDDRGPVTMYTAYERRVIRTLASLFDDLAEPLMAIEERLVDLAPPIRASYYHPDMLGSWSLKALLPTVDRALSYDSLEGIHEGSEASKAYFEAIDPSTSETRREQIRAQLINYCRQDTLAMLRLVQFFESH
ncbi:MAG: DUF2779 domain-containing protein [Xanthomonadales bacterium]|nr:DUF2779 domain-containing protein [Xanthomonadales bacterium]